LLAGTTFETALWVASGLLKHKLCTVFLPRWFSEAFR
jgi:GINS complex protein